MKDRKPEEVEELNLDNVRASKLQGLTSQFTSLKRLSIINVGLSSLEDFPELPTLERLELGDNRLTGGLEHLKGCPALQHLSLVGNRIALPDDLRPLAELAALVSLDLLDCPVTQQDGYRELVFNLLPGLGALDGLNREGEEVEESESEDDEEVDGSESDEPGLDYLQRELGSGSSGDEEDYDPEGEETPEDDIIPSSEGEEGPSSSKRARLDPKQSPKATPTSDSD